MKKEKDVFFNIFNCSTMFINPLLEAIFIVLLAVKFIFKPAFLNWGLVFAPIITAFVIAITLGIAFVVRVYKK